MTEQDKRTRKPKKAPPKEDRQVSAYYMLAQVVEHNTMMMKAFIDMILIKENSLVEEDAKSESPTFEDEALKKILKDVYECAGKEKAIQLLKSHNATKISELDSAMKQAFVDCATQIIKQMKGAIDERQ